MITLEDLKALGGVVDTVDEDCTTVMVGDVRFYLGSDGSREAMLNGKLVLWGGATMADVRRIIDEASKRKPDDETYLQDLADSLNEIDDGDRANLRRIAASIESLRQKIREVRSTDVTGFMPIDRTEPGRERCVFQMGWDRFRQFLRDSILLPGDGT